MLNGDANGLDFENDLGMTASRQAEVRAAIFAMLGDNSLRGQSIPPPSPPQQRNVTDILNSTTTSGGVTSPISDSTEEWSCNACTLLNPSTRVDCAACGTYHMSE